MKKLLFLLFLPFFSLAQTDSIKVLENEIYSMSYPAEWNIKDGCTTDQCTINSERDTLLDYDTYIESINITVNNLSSASYTAEKYANFSIGYLPKVVQRFKLLNKKKLGTKSYRIVYKGYKNAIAQTWMQYYHVKNQKVYIITFSGETRKHEIYRPLIEPYLDTFTFN